MLFPLHRKNIHQDIYILFIYKQSNFVELFHAYPHSFIMYVDFHVYLFICHVISLKKCCEFSEILFIE